MLYFHCPVCGQVLFFENSRCLKCDHVLGFLPSELTLTALKPAGEGFWEANSGLYKMCGNYLEHDICNWMVKAGSEQPYCLSCRLNRTIPNLTQAGNLARWYRLEVAKRRLLFNLLQLRLPFPPLDENPQQGLAFDFLVPDSQHVLTGYGNGVITVNAVEADDAAREKMRVDMNEPYRTLLGHFRHESAHHYWRILIEGGPHLETFRARFGDERQDYQEALRLHYASGAPADWVERGFISSYASAHPSEDWAETWAHYLHMFDTLQTSQQFGLVDPEVQASFQVMAGRWQQLTFALNSINRSMGIGDLYPFVLSPAVLEKLHFVHTVLCQG